MGNGGFVDSSSSDITFAQVHSALGEKEGLLKATDPQSLLSLFNMLGEGNDPDIED